MPKRILIGTIVSDKTDKTVVVKVERKVRSGTAARQEWIRSNVFSTAQGRFINFRMRGLAC